MPSSEAAAPQSRAALAVKVVVIALAFAAAAYFTLRGSPAEKLPDSPEDAVAYICLDDNHVFMLTPAGFKKLGDEGGIENPTTLDGLAMVRCPTTGQFTAVLAYQCPHDGAYFPGRLQDGRPGKCPKCGYSFYPR